MTLKEAKQYINLSIFEGYCPPSVSDGMTEKEIITFAEREGERGDAQL